MIHQWCGNGTVMGTHYMHTQPTGDAQYCGVCKPGEPDKGRQPSQPEPSKLGKGKMYKNTRKHLKHTTLFTIH